MSKTKNHSKRAVIFILFLFFNLIRTAYTACSLTENIYDGSTVYSQFICYSECILTLDESLDLTLIKHAATKDSVNLILEQMDFDSEMISKGWFQTNVSLEYLELRDLKITKISKNAFDCHQFENLKFLYLNKVPIVMLSSDVFNGLTNLKSLSLEHTKLHTFDKNVLAPIENLKKFKMSFCISNEISLDNLFGSIEIPQLEEIEINECNLSSTITEKTFMGLRNIKILILNTNIIDQIGAGSFNMIFKTLKVLNLQTNQIKIIPEGLFQTKYNVKIIADYNSWHCSCEMEHFRLFLKTTKNLVDPDYFKCRTPSKVYQARIINLPNLCNDSSTTVFQSKKCETIELNRIWTNQSDVGIPLAYAEIDQLFIDFKNVSKHFNVLAMGVSGKIVKCKANLMKDARVIRFKQQSTLNGLCMINDSENSTLLKCIGFKSIERGIEAWIMMDQRVIVIPIAALCAIFASFIGILIAVTLAKLFPRLIRGQTTNVDSKKSRSNELDRLKSGTLRRLPNNLHRIDSNNETNGYITFSDIPRPIRPKFLEEYRCCDSENCQCYCEL